VNLEVGFRCDNLIAPQEKNKVITSLKLCPASEIRAIELDNKPKTTSIMM
jgi:hypothetical protein